MRYVDYLRTSVMLLATSAVALIFVSASAIVRENSLPLLMFGACWLVVATVTGIWLGRGDQVMESIGRLLSRSRLEPIFPKFEPSAVLISRLWPVLVITLVSAVVSLWFPQLAIASAGYGLLWAFAWRRQALAVEAIEERDAVHFWIVRSSPFKPPRLVRSPAT